MPSRAQARKQTATGPALRIALSPGLLGRHGATRAAVRLLTGRRLTWSRIIAAGLDAIEREARADAQSRGVDWDRLQLDALELVRRDRERRKGSTPADASAPSPGLTYRNKGTHAAGDWGDD